jgi:O-antigen/teichoic acid export membrane protein
MSRTRRAGIAASFGYLQFAFAVATGILLVPFVLSRVGTEAYGAWIGIGERIAYSAMADLGVLGVLPWLVAEADGRRNREEIGRLVSAGLLAAAGASVLFLVLGAAAIVAGPAVAGIAPEARSGLAGPLFVLVGVTAAAYPLRVFHATLVGVQDVTFLGTLGILQGALNVSLLVGLLLGGAGLYALALAATVPGLVVALVSAWRLRTVAPGLFASLGLPGLPLLRRVVTQGLGGWTAGLGWRMIAATSTFVILALLGPAPAVAFALTARLGEVLTQMSWQLPDAALVGLAQLSGEGNQRRVREVVLALHRLTLVGAGAVACVVLAFNPLFVALWVGPARYAGPAVNALLAAAALALSLGHVLFSTAATLGARVQVGVATVAQGVVHLAAAVLLGRAFGLAGVAAAALVGTAAVAVPAGARLLASAAGLDPAELWRGALAPWIPRVALLLALAAAVGSAGLPWAAHAALAPPLALVYLWTMSPLLADLPIPPPIRRWLARVRLVPRPS